MMEFISITGIFITLLAVIIGLLQLNQSIKTQIKQEIQPLIAAINSIKDDIKELKEDNKTVQQRLDNTNSRIDRLADSIYSKKAN